MRNELLGFGATNPGTGRADADADAEADGGRAPPCVPTPGKAAREEMCGGEGGMGLPSADMEKARGVRFDRGAVRDGATGADTGDIHALAGGGEPNSAAACPVTAPDWTGSSDD